MAKKQVNVRLGDEAITILKWWVGKNGCVTEADVITKALAVYDVSQTTVNDPILDHVAAGRVEPVRTPLTQREVGTFPCRCEHSGCKGAIFKGVRKRETLCPECEAAGHQGDRHDCWVPA